jgi:hypothetical protein
VAAATHRAAPGDGRPDLVLTFNPSEMKVPLDGEKTG